MSKLTFNVCPTFTASLLCIAIAICVGAPVAFGQQTNSPTNLKEDSKEPIREWGSPNTLIAQLETVKQIPQASMWATETLTILELISKTPIDSHAEVGAHLVRLQEQRNLIPQLASSVWNDRGFSNQVTQESMQAYSEVSKIGYRIDRRLAIWGHLSRPSATSDRLADHWGMQASFSQISFDELEPQWVEYLQLRKFKSAFGAIRPDAKEQKKVSREILARLYSPALTQDQQSFIRDKFDPSIIDLLKQHASAPVDPTALRTNLERYESAPSAVSSQHLNDDYQDLLWSDDPANVALANEIQSHYRNANFRLSVSARLLNRMVPDLPVSAMPVSETIQGARVSGNSHVKNYLRIAFEPNPTQMIFRIETDGRVQSDTVARTNTFRVTNQGQANFAVHQRIMIGPNGINSSKPYASSSANQNVVGLESKLDNLPILGWMARRLAENKLRDDAPQTNRMFQEKVQTSAETTMEQQVDKAVAKLRSYSYTNLFQPLMAMDLEPEAIQMATTSNQMVMRYRLAGRDQMAANTARPQDNGNSLLSFQIHQSAINNAIARIGLNGNKFTIDELIQHLNEVLGTSGQSTKESDQKAEIGFAQRDPIKVEFVDERLNITLNLKSLKIGDKGKRFKNVSMKVSYRIDVNGFQVMLNQDDTGTKISSKKFFEKAAISTVMKVLFEKQYTFNALPKSVSDQIGGQYLEVSQLVLSDGWMGVSMDDRQTPAYQANSQNQPQQRVGAIRRFFNRR